MGGVNGRPREIVVRTARDGDGRVCLGVRDAGTGFPPHEAGRLFDAFYTTKPGGMGIGLSVSRSIVESHGGRLRALPNDDGPGATFEFSVPCWAAAHADRRRRPPRPTPSSNGCASASAASFCPGPASMRGRDRA
jgi:nitrogen fixation/metabolism regulation signal transduction histidine kinase